MTTIRILSVAIFAAASTLTATAQTAPAPAASMPMAGATMPLDCAKPMAKHDHGAERGMPTSKTKSVPCTPTVAATTTSESASAPKKQLKHNHSTFHKTM